MDETKKALNTLARPMVEWEAIADKLTTAERGELANTLNQIAQRATRAATYFEERYGYGCGDQGHATAVKKQNKVVERVRRVLGFSAPRLDVTF